MCGEFYKYACWRTSWQQSLFGLLIFPQLHVHLRVTCTSCHTHTTACALLVVCRKFDYFQAPLSSCSFNFFCCCPCVACSFASLLTVSMAVIPPFLHPVIILCVHVWLPLVSSFSFVSLHVRICACICMQGRMWVYYMYLLCICAPLMCARMYVRLLMMHLSHCNFSSFSVNFFIYVIIFCVRSRLLLLHALKLLTTSWNEVHVAGVTLCCCRLPLPIRSQHSQVYTNLFMIMNSFNFA